MLFHFAQSLPGQPTFSWPSLLEVHTGHNTLEISIRLLPPHRKIKQKHPTHFASEALAQCLPQKSWKA